jgi:hypothetical protein
MDSLERASYGNDRIPLIISVDKSNTNVVEDFADNYVWPYGDKIVQKHGANLGLKAHMLSLGKWFNKYDALIVLEDDLIVSDSFYFYAKSTVRKYYANPDVAGISLYGFSVNYQTGKPFQPYKSEHDVYFMNCAMSWGQIWMRDSWMNFYRWYNDNMEFSNSDSLPDCLNRWGHKSWLKYHTRYCIEENKYFVFPYTSLSTNCSEAGEHNNGTPSTVYQVQLQAGLKTDYALPDFGEPAVYYDGFFENKNLYDVLGYCEGDLCLDLNGEHKDRTNKRYWLTTASQNFKVIKSYNLNYRPIEANIYLDNVGSQIFLYDTSQYVRNETPSERNVMMYQYYLDNILSFIKMYGARNLIKDIIYFVKNKLLKSKI